MRTFFTLLLLLSACSLIGQNSAISSIHQQIESINQGSLNKSLILNQGECAITEYAIFRDKNKVIRKISCSYSEGCAVEDGFSYKEYFNEEGQLIFHFFSSLSTYQEPVGYFKGSFYYHKGDLLKKEIANIYYAALLGENEPIDTSAASFPIIYSNQPINQYCLHETVEDVEDHFGNIQNLINKKNNNKRLIINNNNVLLRKEPNLKAEILAKLMAFQSVYLIEKGNKQSIQPWGTFCWYKVKFDHDQPKPITGWVFGAFVEPPSFEY